MPTYEYECENCKEHFEAFQSMTADPVKTCSKCGGNAKRLIGTGGGIIFKGKGFYATDYRKGKKDENTSCPLKKQSEECKSCPAAKK